MPRKTAAQKAAEEAAAAEVARRETEGQRLRWGGAILFALALFAGGYAIGQANAEEFPPDADFYEFERDLPPFVELQPDEFRFDEGFERSRNPRDRFPDPLAFPCRILERGEDVLILECAVGGEADQRIPDDWSTDRQHDEFPEAQGFLGVAVVDAPRGVLVTDLAGDGPAAAAGIEIGDRILQFDGIRPESAAHLADLILGYGAGAEVEITLLRFDSRVTVWVLLGERPPG